MRVAASVQWRPVLAGRGGTALAHRSCVRSDAGRADGRLARTSSPEVRSRGERCDTSPTPRRVQRRTRFEAVCGYPSLYGCSRTSIGRSCTRERESAALQNGTSAHPTTYRSDPGVGMARAHSCPAKHQGPALADERAHRFHALAWQVGRRLAKVDTVRAFTPARSIDSIDSGGRAHTLSTARSIDSIDARGARGALSAMLSMGSGAGESAGGYAVDVVDGFRVYGSGCTS